jgi:hypothetical protein
VVLFSFVYLYLFAAGAGPYNLDTALFGRRRARGAHARPT